MWKSTIFGHFTPKYGFLLRGHTTVSIPMHLHANWATFKKSKTIFAILQPLNEWYFCKIGVRNSSQKKIQPRLTTDIFCYGPLYLHTRCYYYLVESCGVQPRMKGSRVKSFFPFNFLPHKNSMHITICIFGGPFKKYWHYWHNFPFPL